MAADRSGEPGRIARLLSTTMLTGFALALPIPSSLAQTIVDQGTLVVSSDAQLGGDSVTVDNEAGLDATLQINTGVSISNEIIINNQGTLNNEGTISRGADDDNAVASEEGGATINNLATGTIEANGVDGQAIAIGGTVQVTNAGTIQALGDGGRAVYLYADQGETLTVDNQATGDITGAWIGVQLNGNGTVTNSGLINATAEDGIAVYFGMDPGSVVNQSGGRIEGTAHGVVFDYGGALTNSGRISATEADGTAVYFGTDPGSLINESDGRIVGTAHGVTFDNGGTLTNSGTISATEENGTAVLANGNAIVTNAGIIQALADDGHAVYMYADQGETLTVDNLATAEITGAATGVQLDGDGTLSNYGLINATAADGIAVLASGYVTVTNGGNIQALADDGRGVYMYANDGETLRVDNLATGEIIGAWMGVQINGVGSVSNSGLINATAADGAAVYFGTDPGSVVNQSGGRIEGAAYGVQFENGGDVTNKGTGSTISASEADGIGVLIEGGGTLSNMSASITGGGTGVRIWGAATLANTGGAIRATTDNQGHGVEIVGGFGHVTNQDGSSISGKLYGVSFADGGMLFNIVSSIIADGTDPLAAGVSISGGQGTVINTGMAPGGVIKGPSAGVRLSDGGTVINDAGSTIEGAASIETLGGNTTLSNAGALIGNVKLRSTGTNDVTLFTGSSIDGDLGIGTVARSTLTLDGDDSQLYSAAVSGATTFSTGTLVKQGLGTWILDKAMTRSGASRVDAGTLAVANNGGLGSGAVTVSGTGATLAINTGVSIANDIVVNNGGALNNAGTIARASSAVRSTAGVATVTNTGTLRATGANSVGVQINAGAGTIANTGQASTISGAGFGVKLAKGGTVTNTAGTISSSDFGSAGVYVTSGLTDVTNTDGGLIQGVNYGVLLAGGGTITNGAGSEIKGTQSLGAMATTTLVNAGKLTGSAELNFSNQNSAHQVTLFTGSSIDGRLTFGSNTAARLTLDGAGDQLYSQAVTGVTSFAGTLVKQGLGTWTLDQTLNGLTTGATRVVAGTLKVDTRLASASVDVQNGATLTGRGVLDGAVNIADGGHLSLRTGAALSAASLVLNADSNLDVALGAPSDTRLLALSGDLALDGKLNVTALGGFGRGAYRLIDYTGTLTYNGLDLGDMPLGYKADDMTVQTSILNQVNLVVGASTGNLRFWNGSVQQADGTIHGGSGTWNAVDTNWTTTDGQTSQSWAHDFGIFSATGGTVTVNGTQLFSGLQFAADGYTLVNGVDAKLTAVNDSDGVTVIRVNPDVAAHIDVAIDGSGGLDKRDQGKLILTGTNGYTGGTTISAGTLQVSSDANLGATSGGLTFNGGTLATIGTFDISRDITLAQTGTFDVSAGGVNLTGVVSGSGDLVKTGTTSLRLSNSANAYGNTLVEEGALVGNAASISGNIGNAASVTFDQANDARFAGDIVGLDDTKGTMFKLGAGNLTLGGISTLDWIIQNGGVTTAAERFGGNADIASGTTLTFDQASNAAYGGVFSGTGDFIKSGAGTLVYDGNSRAFTGTSSITAGLLIVGSDAAHASASLGGSMSVQDGATLGGHGTVGSGAGSTVTIASGGTLSPGNSIGTLTVDGDLVFAAGSHFVVEVNPDSTDSDLVTVTGNATLKGGSVAHIGANGDYAPRSTYTILSANGTLSGAFADVTSDFAFLTPDLIYDYGASTVALELTRNQTDFASVAHSRNQRATGQAIDSIGFAAGHAVYDAIVQLPDDANLIRASFDALSGEIHGSVKTALIEDSRFIRNAVNDRIRAAFGDTGAALTPVLAYGPGDTPLLVSADYAGPVFWSYGFGSWGSADSDGNAAALDRDTGGLLLGADGLVGDWRLGLLAGYSHSSFKVSERASSGSSDNYHLGLYGGTQWGNLALRTGVAYTSHDIDTSRAVVLTGLSDHLTAGYSAGTFQAFGELGYGMNLDNDLRFEPFANLAHVRLHTNGFTEAGGAAALTSPGSSIDVTFTTLGLRAATGFDVGGMATTLNGMVGWRHAFGDTTPESTHAFSAGDAFTIAGAPIARNSAVIEAGLDLNLTPNATFGLSYQGQIASGARDHGFKASLAVQF